MQIISKLFKRFKPPKRILLDNAAQFFPGASSRNNTWVFRLTCELTEEVDPWTLQYAVEDALKQYPLYRSVLHKGLFWYSLEESKTANRAGGKKLTLPHSLRKEPPMSAIFHYL